MDADWGGEICGGYVWMVILWFSCRAPELCLHRLVRKGWGFWGLTTWRYPAILSEAKGTFRCLR